MEDYSAIDKNKLVIHAITWMNLKSITLSEKVQMQKAFLLKDSKKQCYQNRYWERGMTAKEIWGKLLGR